MKNLFTIFRLVRDEVQDALPDNWRLLDGDMSVTQRNAVKFDIKEASLTIKDIDGKFVLSFYSQSSSNEVFDVVEQVYDHLAGVSITFLTVLGFEFVDKGIVGRHRLVEAEVEFNLDLPEILYVLGITPADEAIDIAGTNTLAIQFDRNIEDNTLAGVELTELISLSGLAGVNSDVAVGSFDITTDTLTITLDASLIENGNTLSFAIPNEDSVSAVDDGGIMEQLLSSSFTLAGPVALTVASTTPVHDSVSQDGTSEITVTFSRNVVDASGEGDLKDAIVVSGLTGDNYDIEVASATILNSVMTITLTDTLTQNGDTVIVTVADDYSVSAADDDGLLAQGYEFSFTLDELTVSLTVPADSDTEVVATSTIAVTFDETIEDVTGGEDSLEDFITVEGATSGLLGITSAVVLTNTLTVTLDAALAEDGDVITVTLPAVGTVAGDSDGNVLAEDLVFSFTMVDTPEGDGEGEPEGDGEGELP